jgi:hypothetical protein
MSTNNGNNLPSIASITNNMGENYASYMITILTILVLMFLVGYLIYLSRLQNSECDYMNGLYPSIDGNLKPISSGDPDCSCNLYDYYIKTAYNACSGGSYKNDYVNICNLKAVIKQGVRCLDFEVYSINDEPVVATSTTSDYFVKETFNYVRFSDVMSTISNYAFAGGTCPNPTDPLIIHLRIKSNNLKVYENMATLFSSYDSIMLGSQYSFENAGQNLGSQPLLSFQNKIILIVDKMNNTLIECPNFLEYVNLTSNSVFMYAYTYYDVQNNPDINELIDFNKRGMTIVFPNSGANPGNPSGALCRAAGCQMVAMRYQYNDSYLSENNTFFDGVSYAFALKPANLRYEVVTVPDPTPQDPANSYESRTMATKYYSYQY